MIIGEPGCRKSAAIKKAVKLLGASGYESFAADKTTKEKFLVDLEGNTPDEQEVSGNKYSNTKKATYDAVMAQNLWGPDAGDIRDPKEVFVAADEFNEYAGTGNLEFFSLLGSLWDWDRDDRGYTSRIKNGRSVDIFQPTINILGGITPEQFALTFPSAIIGQGFLSRMIFIHGVKSERRYTIPPTPDAAVTTILLASLQQIRTTIRGCITISPAAFRVLDAIYNGGWKDIDDVRFKSYSNRRFTQLLKLCAILSASAIKSEIDEYEVVYANTILAAAEHWMPEALGEFGKSKNSDVVNKITALLAVTNRPLTITDIWKQVHKDLAKTAELQEMMQNLQLAGKIQMIKGKGWLPLKVVGKKLEFVDWGLLTDEERKELG